MKYQSVVGNELALKSDRAGFQSLALLCTS